MTTEELKEGVKLQKQITMIQHLQALLDEAGNKLAISIVSDKGVTLTVPQDVSLALGDLAYNNLTGAVGGDLDTALDTAMATASNAFDALGT